MQQRLHQPKGSHKEVDYVVAVDGGGGGGGSGGGGSGGGGGGGVRLAGWLVASFDKIVLLAVTPR